MANKNRLRVMAVAACPFPWARGTPTRVMVQAKALLGHGVDVRVVTYHLKEFDPPESLKVDRIPFVPTCRRLDAGPTLQKGLVLDPLLLLRTLNLARHHRPDLLHGHHVEGGLVALAVGYLLHIPRIFDMHTLLSAELAFTRTPGTRSFRHAIGERIDVLIAQLSDSVITPTAHLRERLLAASSGRVRPDRVTVVPNSLDPEDLPRDSSVRDPGARAKARTLVYAGSLSPIQRLDLLGQSFDCLVKKRPEAELVIVSEDPFEDLLSQWPRALEHPNLRFVQTSKLEEVFDCLQGSDVAISLRTAPGGHPRKLLNYMGVGLPIVTFKRGAETLIHGKTGWIVPNENPEEVAQAVLKLLRERELRRKLGNTGRNHVRKNYSYASVGERIMRVYQAVSKPPQGHRVELP